MTAEPIRRHAMDFQVVARGLKTSRWSADLGYERFDGDGISSFQTPLGPGHAVLGWSDVISATPALGVRDLFVPGRVSVPALGRTVRLAAEAHAFHDADGAFELGREIDLSPRRRLTATGRSSSRRRISRPTIRPTPIPTRSWLILEYRY